jgi:hypothetical protein
MPKLFVPDAQSGATSTPPKIETIIPPSPDFENSAFEKVADAGQRVFEKFGVILKRGRGRPKKDGSPKASDVVDPAGAAPGSAPVPAGVDPVRVKLFVAGCKGVIKGAVAFCKGWCRGQAKEAGIEPGVADAILAAANVEDDYKGWCDALEVCANQYGWDFEHMPAVVLTVETGKIFVPFWQMAREFRAEIARQRAADEARSTRPNPPAKP